MKMQQQQEQEMSLFTRFYIFLRNRDAKIIELFFLGLNMYILAFVLLPPYSINGLALILRVIFQVTATIINIAAVLYNKKVIRMTSAVSNTTVMAWISTGLIIAMNAHAGTYVLLTLLSAFVCWKINTK